MHINCGPILGINAPIQKSNMLKIVPHSYSGKTQKQMQEYVRENFVKRQSFQRYGSS